MKPEDVLPMTLQGRVVHGDKIGRTLGFPTANLEFVNSKYQKFSEVFTLNKNLHGVYACELSLDVNTKSKTIIQANLHGMIHIGPRLVFNEEKVLFEVNIFDFTEEIYDRILTCKLTAFIRPTRKFDGLAELIKQMKADRIMALVK